MAKLKMPGVYVETLKRENHDVKMGETGVVAFIGVTQRGPLNVPVCIKSVSQFSAIFGKEVKDSYLHDSVHGFFANGGQTCFIVRIAHVFRDNVGELAKISRYEALDATGYPVLEILASSEGSWGNDIAVSILLLEEPRVRTFLAFDVAQGERHAVLQSARGLEAGMFVAIYDQNERRTITLTRVRGNEIWWAEELDVPFKAASPSYLETLEFNMEISYESYNERFPYLSLAKGAPRNVERILAHESMFVRAKILDMGISLSLPEALDTMMLYGGKDGLTGITPDDIIGYNEGPDARYGIACLEANDSVDLVAIPDLHYFSRYCPAFKSVRDLIGIQTALLNHCERMADRFALLDFPEETTVDQAQDYRAKFESSYGAIYYPWLRTLSDESQRYIPPVGVMAGLCARCDREEGVYRAPANIELVDVIETKMILNQGHIAELNAKGINCIRSMVPRGIRPWGARTLTQEPAWRYLTSRRVFNAIKRAIYESTQWVVFEPNGDDLRRDVETKVSAFLEGLWASGYFKGKSSEQAFDVQCSDSNNSPEEIEEGMIIVDVGLALSSPLEFIYMSLEHHLEDPGSIGI